MIVFCTKLLDMIQPSNGPSYVIMLRPTPYVLCIRCAGVRFILVSDIQSLTVADLGGGGGGGFLGFHGIPLWAGPSTKKC